MRELALEGGALAAEVNDGFTRGGEGAAALAQAVADACEQPSDFTLTYHSDDSIEDKIHKVATKVYGAADVVFYLDAQRKIKAVRGRRTRAAADLHGEDAPVAVRGPRAAERAGRTSRCRCATCVPTREPAGSCRCAATSSRCRGSGRRRPR